MDHPGIWSHPLLRDPALGACIQIDPLKCVNPDCDIHLTGQYETFQFRNSDQKISPAVHVDIDHPRGKHSGRLSRSRVTVLHIALQIYAMAHLHITRDTINCKFANQLHRYTPGKTATGQATHKQQYLWATLAPVSATHQQNLGLYIERFASPMDFDPRILRHYFPT